VKDYEFDYFGLCDVDRETLMTIAALYTGTTDLLAALDEGVLTLTLNRPEARNAMSRAMNHALARQLAAAALEPNVRCIVLTGAGKGFCAGGDVKAMAASADGTVGEATIDEAIHRQRVNQRETAGALFKMPKPTLAALPGPAAGAFGKAPRSWAAPGVVNAKLCESIAAPQLLCCGNGDANHHKCGGGGWPRGSGGRHVFLRHEGRLARVNEQTRAAHRNHLPLHRRPRRGRGPVHFQGQSKGLKLPGAISDSELTGSAERTGRRRCPRVR
jgi:hypothetical protein